MLVVSVDSWWDSLVRDRSQAILELVINAIADDYENVEIIVESINELAPELEMEVWAARSAIPVSRPEVIKALKELTREGYAQSYSLATGQNHAQPRQFRDEDVRGLWFCITAKGKHAIERIHERIAGNQ